ncbi:MAG: xanthine dehydrogenase family protein molybdopterin-binding subunit [Isosphaeraceae bacterium]|nr:xanthine dehydrogenase family protein molybdopterin-binding subunit [Isosphaeraceae bacterium]
MAGWPESPRLIGTEIPRLDGLAKASGRAKYPSDMNPPGLLHGAMLWSPHAHAKIKSIDLTPAEKSPGVKAVVGVMKEGATVRYQGEVIAAVAAETEEKARDAVRAIKIEFEVLPHVVTEAQAMDPKSPEVFKGRGLANNTRKGNVQKNGDPEGGLEKADVKIEGHYSAPVITHVCLEPHGLTAKWDGPDKLTAWASTQAVQVTANELAGRFEIPATNVTVLTDVMGGGFGSKFGADLWGLLAAELSKKADGKPVKMFLDRAHEHLAAGNRPSAFAHVRLGATKDGKITGMIAETHGTGGASGGANFPLPYVYLVENRSRSHSDVFVNGGGARAMRAPGHPQGCIIMEAAMDDLADALGMDPLEFRLKNLGERDVVNQGGAPAPINRTKVYQDQVRIGAELIGWAKRKPRGTNGAGPIKKGYGMALHQWGGGGAPDKQVECMINPDGSVEVRSATQDIGTGARTILAIIAAEVLGLEVKEITSNIGNSTFKPGQASGGSTTTPSMSPPCYNAVLAARAELFEKIAPKLGAEPGDLSLAKGQVLVKGEAKMSWKDACRQLGMVPITTLGKFTPGLSANGVGGCQFAEVDVDVETGVVKVVKIVAVQDSGLIIDKMTWNSQVYGGIIGGLNYGLFEERVMDPTTGVMLNADMELYKLAGASDIPEIVVRAYETEEMKARGVIGIGEPPTIATAAAIGNAVTNAVGVRVPHWPMSPMNVLNALASNQGKA